MEDIEKPGPGTPDFVHITPDGERKQYERPDMEINEATPTCDEHDQEMVLARLDENPATQHQLGFKCPEAGCHRITWLE